MDSADSTVNTWTELTENVIVRTDIGVSYDIVNKNSSIQVGDYTVYRQKDGSMTVFYDNKLLYLQLNDDGYYETTINENLVIFEIAFDSYGDLNSAKLVN